MKQRADDHVISIHALHIVNIERKENRQKAIGIFSDVYDVASTDSLKRKINELWPARKKRNEASISSRPRHPN